MLASHIYQGKAYEYHFLVDSKDLDHICEYFGINQYRDDITGAIVKVEDGDYSEAYFTESSKPYSIYAQFESIEYYISN